MPQPTPRPPAIDDPSHLLAHPTRLRLLQALGGESATISQLANRLHINKGNVAHHLGVMRAAGLVRAGRSRTVRGGTEQYFEPAARAFRLNADDDGTATRTMLGVVADDTIADPDHLLDHRIIRLGPDHARALREHLASVVAGLKATDSRDAEYGVIVGVARR